MRYINACLRLFVVILQDLHCLQRFYHNVDHWGIKLSHLDIGLCGLRYYTWRGYICLFYKKYIVFNMTMHYTHSGTTSLYQISCLNVLPLVS